jgi:hypothetical protein
MFTTEYEHSCMLNAHPLIYFPKIWNDCSVMIRSTPNKNIFKKETKDHFLEKLSDNYVRDRLLCPHCHL